jgi:hypothetical protein
MISQVVSAWMKLQMSAVYYTNLTRRTAAGMNYIPSFFYAIHPVVLYYLIVYFITV